MRIKVSMVIEMLDYKIPLQNIRERLEQAMTTGGIEKCMVCEIKKVDEEGK